MGLNLANIAKDLKVNVEEIVLSIRAHFSTRNLHFSPVSVCPQNETQTLAVTVTITSTEPRFLFKMTFSPFGTVKVEYLAYGHFLYKNFNKMNNEVYHISEWPSGIVDRFEKILVGYSSNSLSTNFVSYADNITRILDSVATILDAKDVPIE